MGSSDLSAFKRKAVKRDVVQLVGRPTDVPDTGLICDLLWADPDKEGIGSLELSF